MAEIFEIDDIPSAAGGTGNNSGEPGNQKSVVNDKHLPSFDFDGYPDLEDDGSLSPRIVDDTWKKYEVQSSDETGATNLRHDP